MKRRSARAFFLCLAMLAVGPALARTVVSQITVVRQPHHWKLQFPVTGHLTYHFFKLKQPDRLVLDIKGAHLAQKLSRSRYVETPVANIRTSNKNSILRMVFDLEYPVKAQVVLQSAKAGRQTLVLNLTGQFPELGGIWKSLAREEKGKSAHHAWVQAPREAQVSKRVPLKQRFISAFQPKKTDTPVVIVIDPGHGGKDPGAIGARGTREKTVVLAIAKDLQRAINKIPGFKAVLTRRSDYFISLRGRLNRARRYHANMFIAIHADAFNRRRARGVSVFALSQRGATTEAARWLATRENASELMGGVALDDKEHFLKSVLISLSQTATIRASLQIGQALIGRIGRVAQLHHRGVEQAAFVVLKSPDIPSLLVETGFLSNRYEERLLGSSPYRHKLAAALSRGIKTYFTSRPPRGTWLAWDRRHGHKPS